MKRSILAGLALMLAAPGAAADYRLELKQEALIEGRFGLHAADSRSAGSLVRVISPGSLVSKRGTVRVLVMNLGTAPFDFGPAQVRLELADGTVLPEVPLSEFRRGEALVTREMGRAASVDRRVKGDLSSLAAAGASGMTAQSLSNLPGPGVASGADAATRQDRVAEDLPGGRMLNAIQSVLQPETVAPQQAAGGYLLFELPKALRALKTDLPLTIIVRAGREEHRFGALLKRD